MEQLNKIQSRGLVVAEACLQEAIKLKLISSASVKADADVLSIILTPIEESERGYELQCMVHFAVMSIMQEFILFAYTLSEASNEQKQE